MRTIRAFVYNFITSEYLSLLLRYFIGLMFIYASMSKIPYPAEFAKNIEAYRIVPYWIIPTMAVFLPWLEMICGLFLIIGVSTRAAAVLVGGLLLVFTVALTSNVLRGSPISCGCWESVGARIGWWDVIRDFLLFLLTAQIFFFDRMFLLRRGGYGIRRRK
ncbi:MAG: DoxX family membrane protein [Deltaproteobacteria bacterium]|nr:DoxX family membrane protein [Deltaproteobacteria bacterium]